MEAMKIWKALEQPPDWALKAIAGGRLKGKTDINPQWRYEAMTEQFGPCGVGWKFETVRKWTENCPDGQCFAFVDIHLYIKLNDQWSEPIPGNGGDMLIKKEKEGLYMNDEAFKSATTDALGAAMKMIGVAATIYKGTPDTKHEREQQKQESAKSHSQPQKQKWQCKNCGQSITQGVDSYSTKTFGKPLCQSCQKKTKPV